MKYYKENAKDIPITADVDVLVYGSCPAGMAAAIALKDGVEVRNADVKQIQNSYS